MFCTTRKTAAALPLLGTPRCGGHLISFIYHQLLSGKLSFPVQLPTVHRQLLPTALQLLRRLHPCLLCR